MLMFRRSLAADSSDRLTQTWTVAFFLILALVTWLIPLSPVFYQQTSSPVSTTVSQGSPEPETKSAVVIPTYNAACWCPSQFTDSMVQYANTVCGNMFNQILDNNDPSKFTYRLHDINENMLLSLDPTEDLFRPLTTREQLAAARVLAEPDATVLDTQQQTLDDQKKLGATMKEKDDAKPKVRHYISMKTPLTLFLLGLCFTIPHILWSLVSSLSSFNLDLTLNVAVQAQNLDRESRQDVVRDLAQSVSNEVKRCPSSLSVPYILFKFLVLVVAVGELVYIGVTVLPDIESLTQDLNTVSPLRMETLAQMNQSLSDLIGYDGRPLSCVFKIRQLQSVISYSIQCVFTPKMDPLGKLDRLTATNPNDQEYQEEEVLSVFLNVNKAVFTAVLAYLVVITVNALINTLTWLSRLVLGRCGPTGKALPMDARLVLAMSRDNAGPLVTQQLLQNTPWGEQVVQDENKQLREEAM